MLLVDDILNYRENHEPRAPEAARAQAAPDQDVCAAG